jgi:hypothetical protein
MYDKKKFIVVSTTAGDIMLVGTMIHFRQPYDITANYYLEDDTGGDASGDMDNTGNLTLGYFYITKDGKKVFGTGLSRVSSMENGHFRLTENWRWNKEERVEGVRVWEEVVDSK